MSSESGSSGTHGGHPPLVFWFGPGEHPIRAGAKNLAVLDSRIPTEGWASSSWPGRRRWSRGHPGMTPFDSEAVIRFLYTNSRLPPRNTEPPTPLTMQGAQQNSTPQCGDTRPRRHINKHRCEHRISLPVPGGLRLYLPLRNGIGQLNMQPYHKKCIFMLFL